MYINFSEGWLPGKEIMNYMDDAFSFVMTHEDIETDIIELSVSFIAPEDMKGLNRLHRNVDEVTDVLSFPQYESEESLKKAIQREQHEMIHEEVRVTLGDVVICRDKIEEQADFLCHSFERELVYLFTHSILHLLGFDHGNSEDKYKMREIENMTMDKIGLGRKKKEWEIESFI